MKFKKIFVFKSERTESGFDYSDNWKADDFVEIPDKLMEDAIVEDMDEITDLKNSKKITIGNNSWLVVWDE